mmetsp:Transcript_80025/g.203648  ORF Transcript_80025/g.203648 Transcript_80025/m.203648 type:complete len:409 (+) Transcript_80025:457-1683(+)
MLKCAHLLRLNAAAGLDCVRSECQLLIRHHEFVLGGGFVDHLHKLVSIDLLLLQELRGQLIQQVHVRLEQHHAPLVLLSHHALDLRVYELPQLLRHGRCTLTHEVPAHEGTRTATVPTDDTLANRLRHAELCHHRRGHLRALLEVVGCTRGDIVLAIDDLLCQAPTKCHTHAVLQEFLGVQAAVQAVFRWHEDCHASCRASGYDADLRDDIEVAHKGTQNRMPGLVVRDKLALLLGHHSILLLQADHDALQSIRNVILVDLGLVLPRGHDRALIQQIRQVCSGHARRLPGDSSEVHGGRQRLVLGVHLQDGSAALHIGRVHLDLPVETPWPNQCRVQDVRAIRGSQHDDTIVAFEPVHLRQELVDGLLTLVVALTESCTTLPAHRIDLVDEDDAWCRLLSISKQVANS